MRGMRSAYSGVCVCRRRARRHTYVGCAHGRAAERLRAARGGSESGAKGRSKLRFPAVRGRGRDRGPGEGLRGREGTPRAPGAAPREARGRSAPPPSPWPQPFPSRPPPALAPPGAALLAARAPFTFASRIYYFFLPPTPPHSPHPRSVRSVMYGTKGAAPLGHPCVFHGGRGGGGRVK